MSWDRIESIARGQSRVELTKLESGGIVTLRGEHTVLIKVENNVRIDTRNLFTGRHDCRVSQQEAEDYLCKLCLLPMPTFPNNLKNSVYNVHITRKREGIWYDACYEYVIIDNHMLIARGEPVTISGRIYRWNLEIFMEG